MLTAKDVNVTRLFPSGAWEVAAILDNGERKATVYYGYTKREAIRQFIEDANTKRED